MLVDKVHTNTIEVWKAEIIKREYVKEILGKIKVEILKLDDINPDYPMDRTIHISRNEVLTIIDKHIEGSESE